MLEKLKKLFNKNLHTNISLDALGLLTMLVIGINAPSWHLSYIENKVGKVSVKVVKDNRAVSGGSGIHVQAPSGKAYILTNGHVCGVSDDGKEALIQVPNSDRFIKRRILEVYSKHDLCLIEGLDGYDGIELASGVNAGDGVLAVGHPQLRPLRAALGNYLTNSDIQIATGLISSQEEEDACVANKGTPVEAFIFYVCVKSYEAMETTVVIYPGSSGSALVNFWGNLVGVMFAGDGESHYGFAVPLSYVEDFLSTY